MSLPSAKLPASVVALCVLAVLPVGGPGAPNFSGDWVLVTATASGNGRSSGEAVSPQTAEARPTTSHTASGAAFNCGRECSIVHDAQTLTVKAALLASATTAAPAVAFHLDGRPMSVINSFRRAGELPVTAGMTGDQLEIVTRAERFPVGYRQLLSLDGTHLVVVTADDRGMSTVTLKYKKK